MNLWVVLGFIISVVASPLERPLKGPFGHPLEQRAQTGLTLLGYRALSEGLAKLYQQNNNKPVPSLPGSSDQLGPGYYLTPNIRGWIGAWDCVFLTSYTGDDPTKTPIPTAWNNANKVWVPASYGCDPPKPLYLSAQAVNRLGFLKAIFGENSGATTENTCLFSKIFLRGMDTDPEQQKLQMLLPQGMLNTLGVTVQCASRQDIPGQAALAAWGTADWYNLPKMRGTPQRF